MPPPPRPAAAPRVDSTAALARLLGLSRWTVSRAINGHPGVRPETRRRVEAAMREQAFLPNPLARGLRGSRTGLVGVCFQELESPILARKTAVLQDLLRRAGFQTLLELTNGRPDDEEAALRHYLALRVEGVVLVGSTLGTASPASAGVLAARLPVVALDPVAPVPFPIVQLDRAWAVRLKFQHLWELGHRRFALLGFDETVAYGPVRAAAAAREVRRLRLPAGAVQRVALSGRLKHDYEYGELLAERYLALSDPPAAIIALNDRIALGVIKRLREEGREAPRDYSIVGFDNLAVTAYCTPALTTVDQQIETLLSTTVHLLQERLEHPALPPGPPLAVRPVLRVRHSTGPAPLPPGPPARSPAGTGPERG